MMKISKIGKFAEQKQKKKNSLKKLMMKKVLVKRKEERRKVKERKVAAKRKVMSLLANIRQRQLWLKTKTILTSIRLKILLEIFQKS